MSEAFQSLCYPEVDSMEYWILRERPRVSQNIVEVRSGGKNGRDEAWNLKQRRNRDRQRETDRRTEGRTEGQTEAG